MGAGDDCSILVHVEREFSMKKGKSIIAMLLAVSLLPGAVAVAAPKQPKVCKLSDARPANRFGSVLVPSGATSAAIPSDVSNEAEGAATDGVKTPAAQLVEPDDEILSPMISSEKNRKISRRKINRTNKSC